MIFNAIVVGVLIFLYIEQHKTHKIIKDLSETQAKIIQASNTTTRNVVALYEVNSKKRNNLH